MRHIHSASGVFCITLLVAGILVAPIPGLVPHRTASADEIELSFDDEMEMDEFLRAVSRLTGEQIIWNPMDKNIRGKKIIGGVKLQGDKATFLATARGLLTFYELVMIPIGPKGHEILLVMDARQTSSILRLKPDYVELDEGNLEHYQNADGLFITTTITVKHMTDLRSARNALTRIVTGQNIGNVTEVPVMNAFVVTDFAPNVVAIYRLLRQMDKPSPTSSTTGGTLVAITLRHATAEEVAAVLQSQFGPPAAPGRPVRNQSTMAGPAAPRVTPDARTNQVLVSGTDEQIQKVKEAVALLDVPVKVVPQSVHMVRLTHINASQAAAALMTLIRTAEELQRRAGGPAASLATMVAHNETNSLLISASDQQFERLRRLIAEMDTKSEDDSE